MPTEVLFLFCYLYFCFVIFFIVFGYFVCFSFSLLLLFIYWFPLSVIFGCALASGGLISEREKGWSTIVLVFL